MLLVADVILRRLATYGETEYKADFVKEKSSVYGMGLDKRDFLESCQVR